MKKVFYISLMLLFLGCEKERWYECVCEDPTKPDSTDGVYIPVRGVKEEVRENCEDRTDYQNCQLHDWIN